MTQKRIKAIRFAESHTFSLLRGVANAEAIQKKSKTQTKPPKISQTPHHAQINFTFPRTRHYRATKITPKSPKFFQHIKVFLRLKSLKFALESIFSKDIFSMTRFYRGLKQS